jgi:signal transduction histidine kinase
VAHDVRAPLRAMNAYAQELLKESALSSQGQTYLQRIQRAAARLDRLTQEVLTYSQLARAEINLQPIDLDKLVHQIVEQYPELTAHCEHIQIRSPLLPVLGHEGFLTQALANLLMNACKFVEPGSIPKIVVSTETLGEEVRIWVGDNGIGIAPEHKERLFKLFSRIHPEKKYEGTGIGLAMVKKAAERMGGTVGFESEPGKGSRFWIQLRRG